MDTEYLGSRLYSSTPPQFVRGFTFSFPSLFAVGWQQQTPLYSSTFTTGFLVSQLGWYPGNRYNGGSSPSRCFLVTRCICNYGFYTVGVFLFVLFLSDSLAFTTARSLLLQIYTISQMTAKALFSWAEIQFIVSYTLKGGLLLSNIPECSAWVLWFFTDMNEVDKSMAAWGRGITLPDSLLRTLSVWLRTCVTILTVINMQKVNSWEERSKFIPFAF